MSPEEQRHIEALRKVVDSVRNLRPKAFQTVCDPEADPKPRWIAFDELYEAVLEGLAENGFSPNNVLGQSSKGEKLTAAASERTKRLRVAMMILMVGWGPQADLSEIMFQGEVLVPTPPDPNTGKPFLTLKDQTLLFELSKVVREELPEDWDCFFRAESEPAAKRKRAFRRMYAIIGKAWMEESLFPRSMTPENRQKFIIFSLMCHVPGDQWNEVDLLQLYADLVPVEEPDWNDEALWGA